MTVENNRIDDPTSPGTCNTLKPTRCFSTCEQRTRTRQIYQSHRSYILQEYKTSNGAWSRCKYLTDAKCSASGDKPRARGDFRIRGSVTSGILHARRSLGAVMSEVAGKGNQAAA